MRMRNTLGCILATLIAALLTQTASATLVVQDRLTDGDRTDSEGLEAAFLSGGNASASVADDTGGINDGNAVDVDAGGFDGVAGIFDTDAAGGFDTVTPLVGENLEMRYTFRITNTTLFDSVFRFGILNNGGDQQTTDNPADTNDTNTVGFGAEIGVVSGSGKFLEDTNTGGGQNNMLGGSGLGSNGNLGFSAINDNLTHEAVLRLTRTATGYDAVVEFDGATSPTGSFTTSQDVFHQLGWIAGNNPSANDFRLDHVELDRNILRNGTFERGDQITGSVDANDDGAFDDFNRHWNNANTVASVHTGLAGESATAAFLSDSAGDAFGQSAVTGADFQFDFDFATESGAGSDRSLNLLLQSKGSGQINLRVDTAGRISIFDGGWNAITDLGVITFSDDTDDDSNFADDVLNVWHLTILGHDYGTAGANYDIILSSVDNPLDVRTATGLTFWQSAAPTTASEDGVNNVIFTTQYGSTYSSSFKTDFAVDNVSLINVATVIPAPAALPAGLMLLAVVAIGFRSSRRVRVPAITG